MLSVVIPTLNEESYIDKLLLDLDRQTSDDFEIIVSDCRSDDRTREIAKGFGCGVVDCPRKNPACNRNHGAEAADGNHLLFLDADVRVPNEKFIEKLEEELDKKEEVIGTFKLRYADG